MEREAKTVGSLFTGVGGLDLGFEKHGYEVAWQAEINKSAGKVLAHHWPNVPNYEDVTRIRVATGARRVSSGDRLLPDLGGWADACPVDVLVGGFPCQDLSVAGKRRGLAGARSGLFFEFARIAEENLRANALRGRDSWIVIENVPGLLSSNDGRDFGVVLHTLADLGYELSWRVVNSLGFGVPQRRYRLFIVGHSRRGSGPREVLLECEGRAWRPPSRQGEGEESAAAFVVRAGGSSSTRVSPCLDTTAEAGPRSNQGGIAVITRPAVGDCDDDCVHKDVVQHVYRKSTRAREVDGEETWVESDRSNTLNTFDDNADSRATHIIEEEARVRRLTPLECERLQGFPDGWTEPAGADGGRYKAMGNAVTVNVAEWIAGRIAAYEEGRLVPD